MEENKKSAIDRVLLLTQQDPEFNDELRKRLGMAHPNNDKIDQIYELCVEQILREQAENFYETFNFFPEKALLVGDYVNMEHARRRNKFDYYSLCLYEQIERIINAVFSIPEFKACIVRKDNKLWNEFGCKIKEKQLTIGNIIWGEDKNEKEKYLSSGKKRAENDNLSARDKIHIIIFFLKYFVNEGLSYKKGYDDLCNSYLDIYICRNTIHRGSEQSDKDKERLKEIHKKEASFYFEFNWLLTQFIWMTKNYPDLINTVLAKLTKRRKAVITQIYGSAAYVKMEGDSQPTQVPDDLLKKIKGYKINDSVYLKIVGGNLVDIVD